MVNTNKYAGQFIANDEYEVCSIGSGFIANYIAGGKVTRMGAALTNKRIYFSGVIFVKNAKGRPIKIDQRKIVNVRDITGTGYEYYNPIWYLIAAIISFFVPILFGALLEELARAPSTMFSAITPASTYHLGMLGGGGNGMMDVMFGAIFFLFIPPLIFVLLWYFKRKTLFVIEYAGGNIAFDVRWIQLHEQDNFMANIHLVKDALYSTSAQAQGFVLQKNSPTPAPQPSQPAAPPSTPDRPPAPSSVRPPAPPPTPTPPPGRPHAPQPTPTPPPGRPPAPQPTPTPPPGRPPAPQPTPSRPLAPPTQPSRPPSPKPKPGRPTYSQVVIEECPYCGAAVRSDDEYCGRCDNDLPPPKPVQKPSPKAAPKSAPIFSHQSSNYDDYEDCPVCGATISVDADYCRRCNSYI